MFKGKQKNPEEWTGCNVIKAKTVAFLKRNSQWYQYLKDSRLQGRHWVSNLVIISVQ